MNEQTESFVSHLVELRDRLLRAVVAVIIVFVCLMPWAADIYDLARTSPDDCAAGRHEDDSDRVVTPFFVPVKVTLMLAFLIALPVVLYQAWAFIAPGLYAHERRLGLPLVIASTLLFMTRHGLLLLPGVRGGFPVHCRVRAQKHHSGT
jgi:sec-independent protein translocase protein TatC